MKAFWIILAAFGALALAFLLLPTGTEAPPSRALSAPDEFDAPPIAPVPSSAPTAVEPATDQAELVKDLLTERAERVGTLDEPATLLVLPTPSTPSLRDGLEKTIPHATIVPGTLVRQEDGTLLADGRWVIRGSGTAEDPFVVQWDLLASAVETFQPREHLDQIPQRIALLHDAHIRIEGYVAFPLISAQSKELLVMRNQWDGCCIGIPPTAYDAIEVTLGKEVAVNRRHAFLYGTLLGRLRVDPMVIDNWLVGLYLLDDARLTIDL